MTPLILIEVEGGCVSNVSSNLGFPARVFVLNHDNNVGDGIGEIVVEDCFATEIAFISYVCASIRNIMRQRDYREYDTAWNLVNFEYSDAELMAALLDGDLDMLR